MYPMDAMKVETSDEPIITEEPSMTPFPSMDEMMLVTPFTAPIPNIVIEPQEPILSGVVMESPLPIPPVVIEDFLTENNNMPVDPMNTFEQVMPSPMMMVNDTPCPCRCYLNSQGSAAVKAARQCLVRRDCQVSVCVPMRFQNIAATAGIALSGFQCCT